jgi:hypothetical protein
MLVHLASITHSVKIEQYFWNPAFHHRCRRAWKPSYDLVWPVQTIPSEATGHSEDESVSQLSCCHSLWNAANEYARILPQCRWVACRLPYSIDLKRSGCCRSLWYHTAENTVILYSREYSQFGARPDNSLSWLPIHAYTLIAEVEVNLRPTVSRPVCLGVRHASGTRDQFFFLLEISFRQLRLCYFVAPSQTRGRVCNLLYNCFWALPEQSLLGRSPAELTAIFYCLIWDSANLEGQVPIFISPRNREAQLYRGLGS